MFLSDYLKVYGIVVLIVVFIIGIFVIFGFKDFYFEFENCY